ncbi:hypothetical protein ACFV2X_47990 [Streptomyces sp. NPDC059679]|uniref:hypothetical protein n=1 Tax=Streptomyces sp. NPDC059679 TaxID=3346903 RepID=UPI00368A9C59
MTHTPSTYHVRAVLASGVWTATVDELPGVEASHRSLSQLERRVRDSIAQGKHLDAEALPLEIAYATGDDTFDQELAEARNLRHQANKLAEQARAAAAPLAKRLVSQGVSHRDAGTLLAVSGALVTSLIKTP